MKLARWKEIPEGLRDHLDKRLSDRKITVPDLLKLEAWIATSPDVPELPWYKNFDSFTLCGAGQYPRTFLNPDQIPKGIEL